MFNYEETESGAGVVKLNDKYVGALSNVTDAEFIVDFMNEYMVPIMNQMTANIDALLATKAKEHAELLNAAYARVEMLEKELVNLKKLNAELKDDCDDMYSEVTYQKDKAMLYEKMVYDDDYSYVKKSMSKYVKNWDGEYAE